MSKFYVFWFNGSWESFEAKAELTFNSDGLESFDLLWVKTIDGNLIQIDDTIQRQAAKHLFENEQKIIAKLFDNEPDYSVDDASRKRVS